MRNSSVIVIFTALLSLILGAALYFVFQHATGDLTGNGGWLQTGGNPAAQSPAAASATTPFRFNAYPQPRPLPELKFTDANGTGLTLNDFRGKLVLLNVWATWCGPCREEMPTLDRLQTRLGGSNFQVLPLSIDREGAPVVKAFYEELGLQSLGIYVDTTMSTTTTLNILGIPATLLIDPRGREIARVLGPAEWDSAEVIQQIRRFLDKQE